MLHLPTDTVPVVRAVEHLHCVHDMTGGVHENASGDITVNVLVLCVCACDSEGVCSDCLCGYS